jgi:hypothetical protein
MHFLKRKLKHDKIPTLLLRLDALTLHQLTARQVPGRRPTFDHRHPPRLARLMDFIFFFAFGS